MFKIILDLKKIDNVSFAIYTLRRGAFGPVIQGANVIVAHYDNFIAAADSVLSLNNSYKGEIDVHLC